MIDPTRVRTRWGSDPRYVNVDVDGREVGSLVVSSQGEVKAFIHEGFDEYQQLIHEIRDLAAPIASAASTCAGPRE
ncbi:hypothetical protein EV646_12166 [Kribbella antiqua]|uniref:Uncharacterized protein n=1 Tax=Kribbella antiqua TaxID=2512217 RepID=A0A4R2I252_9ACTN|nr:hypothetical protein [Kribbella antiqua]TCO38153.1 hypothetical protein EV646_12166 [Kribbella antiqua]